MNIPTIAFVNNKGGVGTTSLVYHVACMFSEMGVRVLAADLDPQANLSAMFLSESRLEEILEEREPIHTILGCVRRILDGLGDIAAPHVERVETANGEVGLLIGDLGLSRFEDKLSAAWPNTLGHDVAALRQMTAFARIVDAAAVAYDADVALIDVGPNLGAINRAALIGADQVVIPLAPDLFSLQGLRNLGPTIAEWRAGWAKRKSENTPAPFELPTGSITPIGYVVLQHAVRLDRPVKSYARWMERVPTWYENYIDETASEPETFDVRNDRNCLALLKNYRSLMPLAQEARKPMFSLKVADGALGAQQYAVGDCFEDFRKLAIRIGRESGIAAIMAHVE